MTSRSIRFWGRCCGDIRMQPAEGVLIQLGGQTDRWHMYGDVCMCISTCVGVMCATACEQQDDDLAKFHIDGHGVRYMSPQQLMLQRVHAFLLLLYIPNGAAYGIYSLPQRTVMSA